VDLTRAVKGAKAAGLDVTRVEIGPDGRIVLSAGKPAEEAANDLDKWLGRRDAAKA
jgi:hypothetical protein